jgi:hypothetical protein
LGNPLEKSRSKRNAGQQDMLPGRRTITITSGLKLQPQRELHQPGIVKLMTPKFDAPKEVFG